LRGGPTPGKSGYDGTEKEGINNGGNKKKKWKEDSTRG